MNTDLRLLIDEAITEPLADLIRECSGAVRIEYVRELSIRGSSDEDVVRYAKSTGRIVVTTETGMDERLYPVCTHPGIIVLGGIRRHDDFRMEIFRRFLLSGHRVRARDAVTHISERSARIVTHKEIVRINL